MAVGVRSQSAKLIRARLNHDSSIVVLDEQRTVALMPTGANPDFAPRAKKREFKSLFLGVTLSLEELCFEVTQAIDPD